MHFLLWTALWSFTGVLGANVYLEEGETCGGSGYECHKLSDCPTAREDLKIGIRPDICSFDNLLPIVCCRPQRPTSGVVWPGEADTSKPTRRPPSQSISKKMCEKYAEYVFSVQQEPTLTFDPVTTKVDECGRIEEPLIVGGTEARLKEFPHMVQIGYGDERRIQWLCGASLISERFVLSAAHCTAPLSKGPARWARLGDLDTLTNEDRAPVEIVQIVERFNHPNYNKVDLYNDIALYKLERDIRLSPYIRPICLQVEVNLPQNTAIATGWGHTQWGGRGSNKLLKLAVDVVSTPSCNQSYESNQGRELPRGIDGSLMLCAGGIRGKDTCQGDSGGPLQVPLRTPYCTYSLIGVTSFGRGCAENYPGVYTRVSNYVPWIEKIVWPNQ